MSVYNTTVAFTIGNSKRSGDMKTNANYVPGPGTYSYDKK